MPKLKRIPAPSGGWVQNASLAAPPKNAAEVLDNWFPTAEGARIRRGKLLHATIDGGVTQILVHTGGNSSRMFAADVGSIYDVTSPASASTPPAASLSGLTSGDWSWINFGAGGGAYLFAVNGADKARTYDGTSWAVPAITGLDSATATACWAHLSRIWMVEKQSLSAWYLGADAIAGAATEFPLDSVFSKGGSLLFGGSWSIDSGDGLDNVAVFVTDQGEVAVYEGSDPASAATFSLVGVYRIGQPLSKHAHFRAGGDIAIATEDGIVSLAATVSAGRPASAQGAISAPIEDAWRQAVTLRTGAHRFTSTLWSSRTMLVVSVPPDLSTGEAQCFVANVRTGAWCRYTGWDVQGAAVYDDDLFFGEATGKIYRAESTGQDDGAAYTAYWLPKFRGDGSQEALMQARITYRGNVDLAPEVTGAVDYEVDHPTAPPGSSDDDDSAWGVGLWGTMLWGANVARPVTTEWQGVAGVGFATSLWVASTSDRVTAPNGDLILLEYLCETGNPI